MCSLDVTVLNGHLVCIHTYSGTHVNGFRES